ncbi:hypothetical protein [Nonomuraea sp. NPDC050643]|uniref:hypothetical protein n=1 Tax=Nonomuraea sp. NPDC050643 TaxID=3155660 RepID=UPI003406017E
MSYPGTSTGVMDECLAWFKYLSQEATWVPNGRPPLRVSEMDAAWRHNAANWLLRQAGTLAMRFGIGEIAFIYSTTAPTVISDANGEPVPGPDMPVFAPMGEMAQDALERELDGSQQARDADPEGWLKTTPLYQALVKDLPDNIAALARHWSDCDLRTGKGTACTCWKRHLSECPVSGLRDITAHCHCNDNSPEWTL